jgi:VRR-NUC domain
MSAGLPLLMLAAGRKPRLRKARPARPREIVLHCAVSKLLRNHCLPEWLWWHTPNGELRTKIVAAKLKALGVKRGVPDIVLISPCGSARFLEFKRQGGVLSDDQEEFRVHCLRHGIPHSVVFNVDQALAALDQWGCLRIKIGGAL